MSDHLLSQSAHWIARHGHEWTDAEMMRMHANLVRDDFMRATEMAKQLSVAQTPATACDSCAGRGIIASTFGQPLRDWANNVFAHRPPINPAFDQAPVTTDQALLNVAYLASHLAGETTFCFLGDDDFHSLVLARVAPWLDIVVVDADIRITRQISELASSCGLSVRTFCHDLRDGVPNELQGCCQGFYSDPPYSMAGFLRFVDMGIVVLEDSPGAWGVLALPMTPIPKRVRTTIRIVQKHVIDSGFVICDCRPVFKMSPHAKGILSGILRFERVDTSCAGCITSAGKGNDMYEHFY